MKCKLCGHDLHSNIDQDTNNKIDEYEISEVQSNNLCWNYWYKPTYGHVNKVRDNLGKTTENNMSATITTIEYILSCIECKHQTEYGYLWFAIQDAREHVLTSRHKLVAIPEIIWEEDKASEIIHMDIKLVYND